VAGRKSKKLDLPPLTGLAGQSGTSAQRGMLHASSPGFSPFIKRSNPFLAAFGAALPLRQLARS
jgi:hypothetical protein